MRAAAAPPWALAPREALAALGTTEHGLTAAEAAARLERDGPNALPEPEPARPLALLLAQFRSPLIAILVAAAAVTLAVGEHVDTVVIAAVLVLNAVLGFSQEYRAEQSLAALRQLARAQARALRDGRELLLDADLLVVGDVVLVEAGARVPADLRLLHAVALEADESLLTGESTTVAKAADAVAPGCPVGDRVGMLHMGSVVTRGHGRGVVAAAGAATELGAVAGSLGTIEEPRTPLQERLGRFARLVTVAVLCTSVLALVVGVAAGDDPAELFLGVVALAVAAIPEGLPVVLTVVLAISVRRMAARNTIVRHLPAVESLGSCSVIGSDKTGTLTENRMTVRRLVVAGRELSVEGVGYELEGAFADAEGILDPARVPALLLALRTGALCNDASALEAADRVVVSGDPTEVALVVAAAKAGLAKDELEDEWERVAQIPFDPERRYAVTVNERDGRRVAHVKGAPEEIVPRCVAQEGAAFDAPAALATAERLAGEGLRVLALATRDSPATEPLAPEHIDELTLVGLVGLIDPPRTEARAAVERCRTAGIRVVMITGDHARTAAAVARDVGIAAGVEATLTGSELDELSPAELQEAVRSHSVFARVSPEHKLRIVEALRADGETVAVTGDGVNDAPALKAADVGAAMGRSGTDVAKEAADIIVLDDDLGTIVAAVEEGRVAFDNVRNTTFFLVSSGVGTVAAVLASILFRFPLPFVPAQLLWLNLVTNGVQDVALAFEPGERGVLERPPRRRREGLLSPLLWERTLLVGAVMAIGTLALFLTEWSRTGDIDRARTVALTTMVLFQVFHVGNSRSEHLSLFRKSPFSNRFLFLGTLAALGLHVAALHLPPTQHVLRVEPLDARTWLVMTAVALTILVVVEAHKLVRGRRR